MNRYRAGQIITGGLLMVATAGFVLAKEDLKEGWQADPDVIKACEECRPGFICRESQVPDFTDTLWPTCK